MGRCRETGTAGRLSAGERFGFAVGDFGLNLYWQGIGLFLVFFQTDVLGIPAWWAGAVFFLASLWDGLANPVMGLVADRTRTRWGRFRPYILLGSLPLAACFVLVFSAPGLAGMALVAYALGAHLLLRTAYTVVAIPYAALSASITRDAAERTALTGLRMQFAFLGGIAVATLFPALVPRLGGGDLAAGYLLAAVLLGLLGTASAVLCVALTRERTQAPARPAGNGLLADARAFLGIARRSAPLLRLLGGLVLVSVFVSLHTASLVYLLKYVLGAWQQADWVLPLVAAVNAAAALLWIPVLQRWGKPVGWRFSAVLTILFGLALFLAPPLPLSVSLVLVAGVAAGCTGFGVCFWSMLPDTVEFNQWRFGRRDEATTVGFACFAQKVSLGLSAALMGLLLDASGFVPNSPQGPEALTAIRAVAGLLPAAGAALSLLLIWRYPLDGRRHATLVRALARREMRANGHRAA